MIEPLLKTVHLDIGYKTPLFKDLQLSLYPAQLTCLMGCNGAGKSTIIKTLSGLLSPLSGSIMLETENLSRLSELELAKKLGVVLTNTTTIDYMTVFDLVSFGRYPYTNSNGKLSEQDNIVIANALKTINIEHLKNRFLKELSDGERQKAALARVLAQQTNLILLDEPMAFLDFPTKMEMMYILQQLAHENKKSLLFSTHDIEMALTVADHLWIIDEQRNITEGTPQKLIDSGLISKVFDTQKVKFDSKNLRFRFQKIIDTQ